MNYIKKVVKNIYKIYCISLIGCLFNHNLPFKRFSRVICLIKLARFFLNYGIIVAFSTARTVYFGLGRQCSKLL